MFLSAGVWSSEHPAVLWHGGPMGGSVQVRQGTNTLTNNRGHIHKHLREKLKLKGKLNGTELQQHIQRTLHILISIVGCRSKSV